MLRMQGPICGYSTPINLNDGTSCLAASPKPAPVGLYQTTPAVPRIQGGLAFTGGTPTDEAKSLLRPCFTHGNYVLHPKSHADYGKPLTELPAFLAENVGTAVKITLPVFQKYLKDNGISDADLGGPLTTALPKARYLVIHDTSYKYSDLLQTFPDSINSTLYTHNKLSTLKKKKDAHVFISRVGISVTAHDFSVPYSATKFTNIGNSPAAKELKAKFCHVEMIQPRLGTPGITKSDWLAPTPGFTPVELDRLALIYIAASFRHGEWLVPAYHHNVDMGFSEHDDPQNFDLEDWSQRVAQTVGTIVHGTGPADFSIGTGFGNAG
jgi:hypothetical protein